MPTTGNANMLFKWESATARRDRGCHSIPCGVCRGYMQKTWKGQAGRVTEVRQVCQSVPFRVCRCQERPIINSVALVRPTELRQNCKVHKWCTLGRSTQLQRTPRSACDCCMSHVFTATQQRGNTNHLGAQGEGPIWQLTCVVPNARRVGSCR